MARGAGVLPIKKKSAGKKESDQNSDITVFSEENFAGNSETFELSNTQFKTNFDISFKEPVKSIIVSGGLISTYLQVSTRNYVNESRCYQAIPGYCTLSRAMRAVPLFWRRASWCHRFYLRHVTNKVCVKVQECGGRQDRGHRVHQESGGRPREPDPPGVRVLPVPGGQSRGQVSRAANDLLVLIICSSTSEAATGCVSPDL